MHRPLAPLVILLLALAAEARAAEERVLTILHTNDLHSRMLGYGPNADYTPAETGDDDTVGGVARRAALIAERRAARAAEGPVLVLDGGDFTMGSLFHTLFRAEGFSLRLLGRTGYDAVVLGNHEYELGVDALAQMLSAARAGGGPLPVVLASNSVFDPQDPGDDGLEALARDGVVRRWTVLERGGLRVGLFGLLGAHAAGTAKNAEPLEFGDAEAAAREMVAHLESDEARADVVIALSHAGLWPDGDGGWGFEDAELAAAVPGIDVIVSGHTHKVTEQPLVVDGRTVVVEAGAYGERLGELVVGLTPAGPRVQSYTLHTIDDRIRGDDTISAAVDAAQARITAAVLQPLGLTFDQPVVAVHEEMGRELDETALPNLITDAIRAATQADIAFTGNGTIRDDLRRGRTGVHSVADIFRVVPLGAGLHGDTPGYPLIKAQVTGPELKVLAEVFLVAYLVRGPPYFPRVSGMRVHYNPNRVPFDRITRIEVGGADRGYREIDIHDDDETLHSFGCTTHVGKFIWTLSEMTLGLFDVAPRSASGQPTGGPDEVIIDGDPATAGVQEVKAWQALIGHLRSFPDTNHDGIADLPPVAQLQEARLLAAPSWSPVALLEQASGVTWSALGLLLLLVGLLFLAVRRVVRRFGQGAAQS